MRSALIVVVTMMAVVHGEVFTGLIDEMEPVAGDFCFFSFGCWGGKNIKTQSKVAQAMGTIAETVNPLFVIAAGDNFYPSGVRSVKDARFHKTFEDIYTHPKLMVPWLVALGNHDYRGNFSAQIAYTTSQEHNKNKRWYLPSYYYTTASIPSFPKQLEVLVLDCPLLERCHNNGDKHTRCHDGGRQRSWLEEQLDRPERPKAAIVVCHYPMFANGPHVNHKWLISWLQPLLEKHGVAMYINADNHYLQLSQLNNVHYVNSGGGAGYGLRHTPKDKGYALSKHSVFEKIADGFVSHCLRTTSSGTVFKNTFYDGNAKPVHQFESQVKREKPSSVSVDSTSTSDDSGHQTPAPPSRKVTAANSKLSTPVQLPAEQGDLSMLIAPALFLLSGLAYLSDRSRRRRARR